MPNDFCTECRESVEYTVKDLPHTLEMKGKPLTFVAREPVCNVCGALMDVHELREHNYKLIDVAYRLREELITVQEINEILKKYNIGKRPLSELIGWSPLTVTRYIDEGTFPLKEYSDKLKNLLDNPHYFLDTLELNKNAITPVAYRKSKAAVEELLQKDNISEHNDEKKIEIVAKYLIKHSGDITPLALQKLLYYAQGFSFAFYNRELFSDECEAWVHGPVYRYIYNEYRAFSVNTLIDASDVLANGLLKEEEELLNAIVQYLGCYSGMILEDMTHNELPWQETRRGLRPTVSCDRVISKCLMSSFFKEMIETFEINNPTDIKKYSMDRFIKVHG